MDYTLIVIYDRLPRNRYKREKSYRLELLALILSYTQTFGQCYKSTWSHLHGQPDVDQLFRGQILYRKSVDLELMGMGTTKRTMSANALVFSSICLQATMLDRFILSTGAGNFAGACSTSGTSVTSDLASLMRIYFTMRKF